MSKNSNHFIISLFAILGSLVACAGATGTSGATGDLGSSDAISAGNSANTPPLSIPAPVPRTERPEDSASDRPPCHAKVKFKISLKGDHLLTCNQMHFANDIPNPKIRIVVTQGHLDGFLGLEKEADTQCLPDGYWHSEEVPLSGILDLAGTCHISLEAQAQFSEGTQLKGQIVTVEEFEENEIRETSLTLL